MMRIALFKLTAIVIACSGCPALQCKAQEKQVSNEHAPRAVSRPSDGAKAEGSRCQYQGNKRLFRDPRRGVLRTSG